MESKLMKQSTLKFSQTRNPIPSARVGNEVMTNGGEEASPPRASASTPTSTSTSASTRTLSNPNPTIKQTPDHSDESYKASNDLGANPSRGKGKNNLKGKDGNKAKVQAKLNFAKPNPNPNQSQPGSQLEPQPQPTATFPPPEEPSAPKRPRRSQQATSRQPPSGHVDLSRIDLDQYDIFDEDITETKSKTSGSGNGDGDGNGSGSGDGKTKARKSKTGKCDPNSTKLTSDLQSNQNGTSSIQGGGKDQSGTQNAKKKRKLLDSGNTSPFSTPTSTSNSPSQPLQASLSKKNHSISGCSRQNAISLEEENEDEREGKGGAESLVPTKSHSSPSSRPQTTSFQTKQSDGNSSDDGIEFISSTAEPNSKKNGKSPVVASNPSDLTSSSNATSNPAKPTIHQTGLQVKGNLGQGKVAHSFFQKRTKPAKLAPQEVVDLCGDNVDGTAPSLTSVSSGSLNKVGTGLKTGPGFFSSSSSKVDNKKKQEAPWPSRESIHVQPPSPSSAVSQIARTDRAAIASLFSSSSQSSTSNAGGKGKSKAVEPDSEGGRQTLAGLIGLSPDSLERLLHEDSPFCHLQSSKNESQPEPIKGNYSDTVQRFIEKEIGIGSKSSPDVLSVCNHPSISNLLSRCLNSQESRFRPHLEISSKPNYELSSRPREDLWIEKFKPTAFDQVLGNEQVTLYLKQWLIELMVEKKVDKAIENANEIINERDLKRKSSGKLASTSSNQVSKLSSNTENKKRKLQKGLDHSKRGKRLRGSSGSEDEDSLEDWIANDESEEEDAVEDPEFDEDSWMEDLEKAKEKEIERKRKRKKKLVVESSDDEEDGNGTPSGSDSLKQAIHGASKPGSLQDHRFSRGETPATELNSAPPSQETSTSSNSFNTIEPSITSNIDSAVSSSSTPKVPVYSDSSNLTNLIILTGPIGSGKTASVFAVAQELGYNVFELNPGSKRGGKELLQEVGEVGRNHQVRGGGNRFIPSTSSSTADSTSNGKGKKMNAFDQMFAAAKKLKKEEKDQLASGNGNGDSSKMRQSLILIEEADLVYEQDLGFWKGLETFLKTCNRPVVVTCNDLDFIPTWNLAVQEILHYRSPSPSLAVPYLQLLALSEGHFLSKKEVSNLYHSTTSPLDSGIPSLQPFPSTGPLHVFANLTTQESVEPQLDLDAENVENAKSHDLRKSIMQLQFWCQWAVGYNRMPLARRREGEEKWLMDLKNSHEGCWSGKSLAGSGFEDRDGNVDSTMSLPDAASQEISKMKEISKRLDTASSAESEFQRGFARATEIYAMNLSEPSADEEVPVQFMQQLYKIDLNHNSTTLAENGREEEYAEALRELSSNPIDLKAEQEEAIKFNLRRLYHSRLGRTLLLDQGLSPSYYVPNVATLVDYAPCVRRIVQFENSEAKKFNEQEESRIASLLDAPAFETTAGFSFGSGIVARNALGTSRATRNSRRNAIVRREYDRWCRIDGHGAEAAEKGGFRLGIEIE